MSRGAPRGRGRGRGRGGFGFGFGDRNAAGSKEWHEALRMPKKHAGMLYPPMDKTSYLSPPTPEEESIISLSLDIDRLVSRGIIDGIGGGVPWRLPDPRKIVGIEIEQWSEKMTNPQAGPSHYPPPPIASGQKAGGPDEKLDPDKLYMNPEFFPSTLWKGYFEGKVEKPRIKKGKKKKVDDEEGGGAEDENMLHEAFRTIQGARKDWKMEDEMWRNGRV
ncbi:hypothetical protein TREMEDRAFT_59910 [Tremella mesenterica DSM 1558]|uniref:uncharacterized protein n=1 Tax=Tremella mesenterica (strain ATCC 24925 / CBS 8224 / DSM 1558 / NBRC 9311 / NRRL Y-6157 / RJB 2259-6 / UBC 559-6) TaxID=578456 RepID=UPI0003F4A347|nr:uncharacterized protein TREMEDRAFT_59910 [Tremella mesenterica DSM 1558]EIW70975.1 hypothetical protein TREMEDRAFT_59910 [Tremella mesenterica DSM 1558]